MTHDNKNTMDIYQAPTSDVNNLDTVPIKNTNVMLAIIFSIGLTFLSYGIAMLGFLNKSIPSVFDIIMGAFFYGMVSMAGWLVIGLPTFYLAKRFFKLNWLAFVIPPLALAAIELIAAQQIWLSLCALLQACVFRYQFRR